MAGVIGRVIPAFSVAGTLTINEKIKLPDGSASAPSLTFINNTTTGIYRDSTSNQITAIGTQVGLTSTVSDSASAVGVILNTANALAISGAKLLSVKNAGAEKAYVGYNGSISAAGVVSGTYAAITVGLGVDTGVYGYFYRTTDPDAMCVLAGTTGYGNGRAVYMRCAAENVATAAAFITDNYTTLSVAGSKLVSVRNNTVEKAYIDCNGLFGWISGNTQTTVGAAGSASALPSNPTGYLKVNVAGTTYVVPYYNAS